MLVPEGAGMPLRAHRTRGVWPKTGQMQVMGLLGQQGRVLWTKSHDKGAPVPSDPDRTAPGIEIDVGEFK